MRDPSNVTWQSVGNRSAATKVYDVTQWHTKVGTVINVVVGENTKTTRLSWLISRLYYV